MVVKGNGPGAIWCRFAVFLVSRLSWLLGICWVVTAIPCAASLVADDSSGHRLWLRGARIGAGISAAYQCCIVNLGQAVPKHKQPSALQWHSFCAQCSKGRVLETLVVASMLGVGLAGQSIAGAINWSNISGFTVLTALIHSLSSLLKPTQFVGCTMESTLTQPS